MATDDEEFDSILRGIAAAPARLPLALAGTSPVASDEPGARLASGTRIRQYELIRELGRGGMGVIWLARDTRLGRRVAMKFLLAGGPVVTERILAEARATARCSHENIVVVHEVGEHEGRPYMVLEYLEGQTLAAHVGGRRPTPSQAVELVFPVVRALAHAHAFGIVHRDLKPSNVFVTASGAIKVLDFGIAKLFAGDGDVVALDGNASLPSGTLPYMAPEQFVADVDERTDLWALGVILFELCAGRHPLAGLGTRELVAEVTDLARPMPSVRLAAPGISDALERVIDCCLKKRKADRFASARDLADALERLLPRRLARPRADDESPYPGLLTFEEADADRFFGRAREVAQLCARIEGQPITAVVGPSGLGKSSLVRAGVIPQLKASGSAWETLVMRPGPHPVASLANLLGTLTARPLVPDGESLAQRLAVEPGTLGVLLRARAAERQSRILLFVDQFEELFTLATDRAERIAFTTSLRAMADDAAAPLRLVVAMRSDLLDRVAEDPRFMDELGRGLFFLQPLSREMLAEALVQPLEQVGYRFEDDALAREMLTAVEGAPGGLPLLQFGAAKLWEARDRQRKLLTREAHARMGGIAGAMAAHADQVLASLSPGGQRLARAILTRLVTADGTRATAEIGELIPTGGDPAEVHRLVEHLAESRLLVMQANETNGERTVELVHEALIAGWPTLRRWLDEGREDVVFLAELRAAAKQWDVKGRRVDHLWRGEAAEEARRFRNRFRGELSLREAQFLDAALAFASRATRIRRGVVVGVIGLLVAIVAAGSVALVSIRRAKTGAVAEATRAQREAERARAAEQKIKDQLAVIEQAQQAKEKARAEVEKGKVRLGEVNGELAQVNKQLQHALDDARAESQRAQGEASRAEGLARSLQQSNAQLERMLADEKARAERLEKERQKISTHLR